MKNAEGTEVKKQKGGIGLKVALTVSLVVNLVFGLAVAFWVTVALHLHDYYSHINVRVNEGISDLCSEEYRNYIIEGGGGEYIVARNDYICTKGSAEEYFMMGYEKYIESLGLEPLERLD